MAFGLWFFLCGSIFCPHLRSLLVSAVLLSHQVRSNVKAAFFDETGRTKLIVPDRRNLRHNAVQINRFKSSVLKFGNIQGVRGAALAVLSPGNKPPWNMLTYGSVSRAVYLAAEENFGSPNVQATLRAGLTVDEFDPMLPDDVAEHLRDFFNSFHQGITITFAEACRGTKTQTICQTGTQHFVHKRRV